MNAFSSPSLERCPSFRIALGGNQHSRLLPRTTKRSMSTLLPIGWLSWYLPFPNLRKPQGKRIRLLDRTDPELPSQPKLPGACGGFDGKGSSSSFGVVIPSVLTWRSEGPQFQLFSLTYKRANEVINAIRGVEIPLSSNSI